VPQWLRLLGLGQVSMVGISRIYLPSLAGGRVRDGLSHLPPPTEFVDHLPSTPHPSGEQISTTKPIAIIHEMNLIPRRKSAIPKDSDCGSAVVVMGTCRITATDRSPMGNAFRNGRLPSNLVKYIRIGIGWVAGWATSFFLRTSLYLGVKMVTKTPSLSCPVGGITAMGGHARYVCIGYRLRLPLRV